jgi:hypothetical protein
MAFIVSQCIEKCMVVFSDLGLYEVVWEETAYCFAHRVANDEEEVLLVLEVVFVTDPLAVDVHCTTKDER